MLEFFVEDMRAFLRDDSRRPFFLYWLVLAIAIVDIASHYKWDAIFGPHIRGVHVVSTGARFTIFLCPGAQVVISAIFVVCMLKWADLGILFALLYLLFMKVLLYVTLVGLHMGVEIVGQSVEIPPYLFVWEGAAVLALIVYIVKKDAVVRSMKHRVYAVTDVVNGDLCFRSVTHGDQATDAGPGPFDMKLPGQPGEYFCQESVVVEGTPGRTNVRRQYNIQDGPEGRIFVVRDSATGEATNYRSLDETPAPHREAFGRMLSLGAQMKTESSAEGIGPPRFSKRVERQHQYDIQDGPEGRRFIVSDPETGLSKTYRSLDEMPTRHRDVFVRALSVAGEMKSKTNAGGVGASGFSKRVERQRRYEIKDGPEGRRFIVSDPKTGASRTYRSLDEMPARHRDLFVRTLKSAGLWKDEGLTE